MLPRRPCGAHCNARPTSPLRRPTTRDRPWKRSSSTAIPGTTTRSRSCWPPPTRPSTCSASPRSPGTTRSTTRPGMPFPSAPSTASRCRYVRAVGGPISQFVLDVWAFVTMTMGDVLQIEAPAVHDACCVAWLIDPTVFTVEKADVRVETVGRWTKAQTVANFERLRRDAAFRWHRDRAGRLPAQRGDEARLGHVRPSDRRLGRAPHQP